MAPVSGEDLPGLGELLDDGALPPDALEAPPPTILGPRLHGRVVGSAALEFYGTAALLRSVVVRRDLRGTGLGSRLTEAALRLSREFGVAEAYLLTETADLFFPRFGFRNIPRSRVPSSVRSSVEFTSACPASARAMALDLRVG